MRHMSFKKILSIYPAALFFYRVEPLVQFGRGRYGLHYCEHILRQVVQEMLLKEKNFMYGG